MVEAAEQRSAATPTATPPATPLATNRPDFTVAVEATISAGRIGIDIRPHITADLQTVRNAAITGGWTDDTPVPPWVFGPMWPTGVPEGWPEADPKERLVVTVGASEEVPVEEVVEFQNQLHDLLSQLAIAHGGTGLTIDRTDRDVPILVPAGSGVSP